MNDKMSKFVMAILFLGVVQSASASVVLKDHHQLLAALNAGHTVKVKVDLTACSPEKGTEPAQSQGGLRLTAYRVTPDGAISFADDHFTVSNQGTPIRQLIRYSVLENNTVTVKVDMFSLPAYTPYTHTYAYLCPLNQGIRLLSSHPN